jgi:hypothetical protein
MLCPIGVIMHGNRQIEGFEYRLNLIVIHDKADELAHVIRA